MSVPPPLLVQVDVWSSAGHHASYVMDHNDRAQRRVLGEQCRTALNAGQTVKTTPLKDSVRVDTAGSALAELINAGLRVDAAIQAWRETGQPNIVELVYAHGALNLALARVGAYK